MKELKLTSGHIALVDDEDYDRLSTYNWRFSPKGVVKRTWYRKSTKEERRLKYGKWRYFNVSLSNEVMGNTEELYDHKDRNQLNAQKNNLRIATRSQNGMNRSKVAGCSSGFVGVSYHKRDNNWRVQIGINGKNYHVGYFSTELEAASVYNKRAKELFAEFANLNKDTQGNIL